jgi:hypothetical protein
MFSRFKQIGFVFSTEASTQFTAVPEAKELVNSFDLIGDLVSLRRRKLEKNAEYKQRIADVNVNLGSAVYSGVVNNLLRDLGLGRQKAFTITLKLQSSGDPIAVNPRVDILANRIILYKDWRPGEEPVIDKEIRTYLPEDTGFYVSNLVTAINTSECFSASMEDIRPNSFSSNLIRLSSIAILSDDLVKSDRMIKFSATNLVTNTVLFGEKNVFKKEVSILVEDGDYTVDYVNGVAYSYTLPSGNSYVSYQYNIFPLEVELCDIQLFTLNDDDFNNELFMKVELDSGEANGLLTSEGAEIYHDVYKNNKIFWGE